MVAKCNYLFSVMKHEYYEAMTFKLTSVNLTLTYIYFCCFNCSERYTWQV